MTAPNILCDDLGRIITLANNTPRFIGTECLQNNINIVHQLCSILRTSLGPLGKDKIIISENDDITITNDGATILKSIDSTNPVSILVKDLSAAMDKEVGDGTTSIILLAGALLQNALKLLKKGLHPLKIAEGYNESSKIIQQQILGELSKKLKSENLNDQLISLAKTTLNSKIVNVNIQNFSEMCVNACLAVFNKERNDLNMDLIKIVSYPGNINESKFVNGVVLQKGFSHPSMKQSLKNARVAILACPFEPPKIKTKHEMCINTSEKYNELAKYEQQTFKDMIKSLKECEVDVVLCQWGFDDEANGLLVENNINAVRWVGGMEIEQAALYLNCNIISKFNELMKEDTGVADIEEIKMGTENEKMLVIKNNDGSKNSDKNSSKNDNTNNGKTVTIVIKGATNLIIEEIKRCIRDALCSIRNTLQNNKIIYGGGSVEAACSILLNKIADENEGEKRETILSYSSALNEIIFALAENAGMNSVETLSKLKNMQITSKNKFIGVSVDEGIQCMKKKKVFESANSKAKQIIMATQFVEMILKIDEIIMVE